MDGRYRAVQFQAALHFGQREIRLPRDELLQLRAMVRQ
jgi:hypothetical protein